MSDDNADDTLVDNDDDGHDDESAKSTVVPEIATRVSKSGARATTAVIVNVVRDVLCEMVTMIAKDDDSDDVDS